MDSILNCNFSKPFVTQKTQKCVPTFYAKTNVFSLSNHVKVGYIDLHKKTEPLVMFMSTKARVQLEILNWMT